MAPYKYTDYSSVGNPTASSAAAAALYAAEHCSSSSAALAAVNHGGSAGTNSNTHTHYNTHPHPHANAHPHILDNYVIRDIRKQVLPVKLSRMLSDPNFSDIISWMPHGRAWKVLRPRDFTERVAPIYFEYPNYNSFIRLVNAWGFRRITTGVDTNAYFHELFLRDMPHLHKMMKRLSKNEKKTPLDPTQEPDFYKMPPLPLSMSMERSLPLSMPMPIHAKDLTGNMTNLRDFSHLQRQGQAQAHRHENDNARRALLLERILGATGRGGGYPIPRPPSSVAAPSSSLSNSATTAAALQILQELSSNSNTNAPLAPNNTMCSTNTSITGTGTSDDEVYRTILDTLSTTTNKGRQPQMNSGVVEELAAVLARSRGHNTTSTSPNSSSSSLLSSCGIGRNVGGMSMMGMGMGMGMGNGNGNGNGTILSSLRFPSEHDTFTTATNPQMLRLLQSSSLHSSWSPSSSSSHSHSTRSSSAATGAGACGGVPFSSSSSSMPGTTTPTTETTTTYAQLLQLQAQLKLQQMKEQEQEQQGLLYLKNHQQQQQKQQQQQQNQLLILHSFLPV